MPKIYPDTNKFINFYQTTDDNVSVLEEIAKFKSSLVLTDQTVAEFRRNRVSTLNWLAKQFESSLKVGPHYTTALIRVLPGHSELTGMFRKYQDKGRETLKELRSLIHDATKDPVAQKVLALAADAEVLKVSTTPDKVQKAHTRKLLGYPPTSPDKYTIGDELIWELLCSGVKDDLIVVTKDKTYEQNQAVLQEEFKARTGRELILVTDKFSEALKRIGVSPSNALVELEKREKESSSRNDLAEFAPAAVERMLNKEICPNCGSDGRCWGYEGSDGDCAGFFECHKCGLLLDITGL